MIPRRPRCLAFRQESKAKWVPCEREASLVCLYDPFLPTVRHYRCSEHEPPAGMFYAVVPYEDPRVASPSSTPTGQLELPGLQ